MERDKKWEIILNILNVTPMGPMSYVYSTGRFINYKHRKCLIRKTITFLYSKKIGSIEDIAVNMFVNLRGFNHCYQERTQFSMHQRSEITRISLETPNY